MKFEIQFRNLAAVLLAAITLVLADKDFLAEKPSYLKPCKQTDPNFNRCLSNNFQVVFSEWKDGVPGLKTVGSIDPLHIKRIAVVQDNNNTIAQLNVDFANIRTSGISNGIVEDASFDPDKLTAKLIYSAPKLDNDSHYNMKGRILNLLLNGNGASYIRIDDVKIIIALRLKRRVEHDLIFMDIDKLHLDITQIGGFHVHLDNLFNGLKELEDSTNAVINQSWREFYEVLGPAINNGIQTVMADRFKKIFAYVPASYLIEDLSATK